MKPIKITARKDNVVPMSTDEFIKAFGTTKENSKFYHYTPEWLEKTLPYGFKEASNKMLQEYSIWFQVSSHPKSYMKARDRPL